MLLKPLFLWRIIFMKMKRVISAFLVGIFLSVAIGITAFADEPRLLQANSYGRKINMFFDSDSEEVSCKVSNTEANVSESGTLGDKNVPVQTTMLIDISTSIKSEIADEVIKYLKDYVEKLPANERVKIVTFGDSVDAVCDFTSDRYDLDKAVSGIKFDRNQSRIYDAIYNTIPNIGETDEPRFYRTVVITDGVDETDTGITKEELYLKLQNDTYPIDVVSLGNSEKKDLMALSRISGGRAVLLYPGANYSEIAAELNASDILWASVDVPEGLCDGSIRQFDVTVGTTSVQLDIKVPAIDMPVPPAESQPVQSAASEVVESDQSSEESVISVSENSRSKVQLSTLTIVILIGIGVVILAAAVLIAVNASKGKKKSSTANGQNHAPAANAYPATELLGSNSQPANSTSSSTFEETVEIILTDSRNSAMKWNCSLKKNTVITVGRDSSCEVVLGESSVSHKQFKIYLSPTGETMIENLSQSNITRLNGTPVTAPVKIPDNAEIKCGRTALIFTSNNGRTSIL